MNLKNIIEAYLFYIGEPISREQIQKALTKKDDIKNTPTLEEIDEALSELERSLKERGIRLIEHNGMVQLRTAPETGEWLESIRVEELSRDIGKAGFETLAIIAYRGETSKSDIEYIRGVQSSSILRHLVMRGLIERIPNPKDQRSFLYKPTLDLVGYLGLTRIEEMPRYKEMQERLKKECEQENTMEENEPQENTTHTKSQ